VTKQNRDNHLDTNLGIDEILGDKALKISISLPKEFSKTFSGAKSS